MIAGLDSSFDRPTPAQVAAAYAAGVRVWGGYFGSADGLGLATRWSRADFEIVKAAGMTAIGFCSGWDDPNWIRNTAADWSILACVDVERGIRDDGPWAQGWLDASGAGLYGNCGVHAGRRAAFHILAWYPGFDPGGTWYDVQCARPGGPCAWQWQGGHSEFGIDVDSMWLDDSFGGHADMGLTPDEAQTLNDINVRTALLYNALFYGNEGPPGNHPLVQAQATADGIAQIAAAVAKLPVATVDVNALAAALAPKLPPGVDPKAVAVAVRQELAAQLGKP